MLLRVWGIPAFPIYQFNVMWFKADDLFDVTIVFSFRKRLIWNQFKNIYIDNKPLPPPITSHIHIYWQFSHIGGIVSSFWISKFSYFSGENTL